MNCNIFRERLDQMTAQERAADAEVATHLSSCSACQQFASQIEKFDQRVCSQLHRVQVPEGLLERLLSQANEELKDTSANAPTVKTANKARLGRSFTTISRVLSVGLAIALLLTVSLFWSPPNTETPFDYAVAKSELSEKFSHADDQSWTMLSAFDQSEFQIDRLDSVVLKWTLSEPVGVDLGNSSAHDVAAFQFAYQRSAHQKWSGTLIVLPSSKFNGFPAESLPDPSSGVQMLEWSSSDGKLTYLCLSLIHI